MGDRPWEGPGGAEGLKVAIAGGALQGTELTYLARKAGYETLLLDRRHDPPARGLCHAFVPLDLRDGEALTEAMESVDLVIPGTENLQALNSLDDWCRTHGVPLAFDGEAYAISSSKRASDRLFRELGIPAPAPWPHCTFPVLGKPDEGSGSKGVEIFADLTSLEARYGGPPPPDRVIQEYLEGPSYSVEVVGRAGDYTPLQITALEMDAAYDCKRVVAPASLPEQLAETFREMAVTLAGAVGLTGIMDVEAILHRGKLKVLEMDARFPSQTPSAVYHSTGFNMVEALALVFLGKGSGRSLSKPAHPARGSILEHVRVRTGRLSVAGEGCMTGSGPLHLVEGFFGAQEALTNYEPGREDWVATLMIQGPEMADARARRDQVLREILDELGLEGYEDEEPKGFREEGE